MSLDTLRDDLVELIDERVELKLAERLAAQEPPRVKPLTVDELIDRLPNTRTPQQWRRWLQGTRPEARCRAPSSWAERGASGLTRPSRGSKGGSNEKGGCTEEEVLPTFADTRPL
jgi:hypothetical protein